MNFNTLLSYRDRTRLTDRIILSGGLALFLFVLIDPEDAFNLPIAATFITTVVLTVLLQRFPRGATTAYVCLVGLITWQPSFQTEVTALWPIVFVGVLATGGHKRLAWITSAITWYLVSTSPSTMEFLPIDLVSSLILAFLLAASVLVGSTIERVKTQQRNLKAEVEKRRDLMTRALHDSVATKLTSIILRSETLALHPHLDPQTHESLSYIADEARAAIGDVRSLLETMKSESMISLPTSQETLEQQIIATIKLFKSHKLKVRFHNSLPRPVRRAKLPNGMQNVFAELASNILKYSDPASAIDLSAEWSGDSLLIRFSNVVAAKQSPSYLTTGLGLKGIEDLIRNFGGTCTRKLNNNLWITEIEISKKSLVMPQSG
ncbi:signal transduction histidine kinase [Corynebacterium mustelae]|uniref:Signal transduction histidine kinase n=1 Tax=Corynebacterium mustelae TaxID=571915 RepID=A0A0G3H312_9CORY|nr:histidine kinase [Corynebacterium mustelae]AKK07115.1 signal transduction histidine kinase [Corynebacterium mustelae]